MCRLLSAKQQCFEEKDFVVVRDAVVGLEVEVGALVVGRAVVGDWVVGDWLIGDWVCDIVAGIWILGDWVVGDCVVGDWVVGDWVVGDWVVGDWVVGDWVVGDWVVGDWVVGEWVVGWAVVGDGVGDGVGELFVDEERIALTGDERSTFVKPLVHVNGEINKSPNIAFEHVEESQYSQQYVSYAGFGQPVHMPSLQVPLSCGQSAQDDPDAYG